MSALQIHLLGGLQLLREGRRLAPFPTPKSRALFAFLALNRGRLFACDVLAGIFWVDRPQAVARECLRADLWRVRGVVEAGVGADGSCLRLEGNEVGFQAGDDHWLDVAEFERCARREGGRPGAALSEEEAARLSRAVELYRGDLLDGVHDDWCVYERERLRLIFLSALETLMRFRQSRQEWGEAIALGQRLLAADPLREQVHRDLMRCFLQQGGRATPPRPAPAVSSLRLVPGPVPPLLDQVESILADLYTATRHLEETRDRLAHDSCESRVGRRSMA